MNKINMNTLWDAVYERMEKEFGTMHDQLLTSAPQEIIDNAYQIVMKQDILMIMEEHDLPEAQLRVLLELDLPLDSLYQEWLRNDYGHMEQLHDCVIYFADSIMRHQAEQKYEDPATPPYTLSAKQAGQLCEMHEWRASHDRDRSCKLDFNDGVGKVYNSEEFVPFLQKWTEQYGLGRCVRLLAYTVRKQDYDGRYYPSVKDRASYIRFPDGDRINDLTSNVHPCVINASMCELIKLEQERGNNFTIYQLKNSDELHNIRFEPLDRLREAGIAVSAPNYRRIYTALLDSGTTLEDISERFNINNPANFYGHSLSVSDVVVLRREGNERAYYCDNIGFKGLPDFKSTDAEQKLPQKPKKRDEMER